LLPSSRPICSKQRRDSSRPQRGFRPSSSHWSPASPEDHISAELNETLAAHWRIDDALDPGQVAGAVQALGGCLGPVQRLLAVLEQL
jgi:hypothetical protein